ncbi:uncharacterized protein METZ01_LOCUS341672 [marine metagenome]|uniref:Uncharacterized protein n=1 Tax=marine metagenome TaxID=408172 RepID=A0A382QVA2_9ZZZZ
MVAVECALLKSPVGRGWHQPVLQKFHQAWRSLLKMKEYHVIEKR